MIIAVDTETLGLNANAFILGTIVQDNGKELTFYSQKDMYDYIVALGNKEKARGHNLYVYAHNHQYDFIGYADRFDLNIKLISDNPFIVWRFQDSDDKDKSGKYPNILFLDTFSIFHGSLKRLGDFVGIKKLDMPKELEGRMKGMKISDVKNDFELMNRIKGYCLNDSRIVLQFILMMKTKLLADDIHVRRLVSIGQIGLNYLLSYVASDYNLYSSLFEDYQRRKFVYAPNWFRVTNAYKGGMVRIFKLGELSQVTNIDINSMYPYALSNIDLPILRSEQLDLCPKDIDDYKNKVGVAKVLLRKQSDYGSVPVRVGSYSDYRLEFPDHECYIAGTYTLLELYNYLDRGHEILDVDYVVSYDKCSKKLDGFVDKLYKLRKIDSFNDSFYKLVLNNIVGKLAQRRNKIDVEVTEIFEKDVMEAKGFKYKTSYGDTAVFRKEGELIYNKAFCPIIPAYVNAFSRLYLLENMEKINKCDLIYTDTDSIHFLGEIPSSISISDKLGGFKIVNQNQNGCYFAKKTYSLGNYIKCSGADVKEATIEKFKNGQIGTKKMIGLIQDFENAGKFVYDDRNLFDSMTNTLKVMDEISMTKVFFDALEKDYANDRAKYMPIIEKLEGLS